MTEDIAKWEERGETRDVARQTQDPFFSMIERLASRPDIDVTKIEKLIDMNERIIDKQAEQAFNASMVIAQKNMKAIPKDKFNTQTNSPYSSHETILKYGAPIYTAEGFSLTFYEGDSPKENKIRTMCDVLHEQGHTKTRHIDLSLDKAGIKGSVNKTPIHAEGSTFSYGRRYLTCMIFNIPTGDDNDGNQTAPDTTVFDKWYTDAVEAGKTGMESAQAFWKKNSAKIKKECGQIKAAEIYEARMKAVPVKESEREPGEEG